METHAEHSEGSWPGNPRDPGGSRPGRPHVTVLGSLTVPGHPEQVAAARAFVKRTLNCHRIVADTDSAALLTSEIVTNAITHTRSGADGGIVTIVVIGVPDAVLVEVIDDGSPGTPVVKGDLYAAEGHGLYLVQQLAAQWGYQRDRGGTTVWFQLPAELPRPAEEQKAPQPGNRSRLPGAEPYPSRSSQVWAAAMRSAEFWFSSART